KIPVKIKEGELSLYLPYQVKSSSKFFNLFYNKNTKLFLVHTDFSFIVQEETFDNLIYQVTDIKTVREILWDEINLKKEERDFTMVIFEDNTESNYLSINPDSLTEEINFIDEMINNKKFFTLNLSENILSFFKTESEIISRSNTVCVVALLDQWFIDYSKVDWKAKANICLKNLISHKETKLFLKNGMDWIGKWAFSRSFGIGTSFNEYVIDSLSDSTIYMSLYTFYHLLSDDMFGKSHFEVEEWMFDYIYKNVLSEEIKLEEKEIFCSCLADRKNNLEENLEFYNNYVEENEVVEGNLINEIESLVDEVNNVICSVEDEDDEAKKLISENMKLIRFIDNELSKLGG
ncbi:leucyl-tRNA synthetase, partial [Tubulinosema ratisbonensis]